MWIERSNAFGTKVLARTRAKTVRQFLRIWLVFGLVLCVPVGVPCAVMAGFWLPIVLGIVYSIGWTVLCVARFGWQGIKANEPMSRW
jgi:hypothetical protein